MSCLNPLWLRSFTAFCEERNFTKAAARLNMTQPGMSQHVTKLEQQIGAPLVDRDASGFLLTEAGKKALALALERWRQEEQFFDRLRIDGPDAGKATVACSGSMAMLLYPSLIDWMASAAGLAIELTAAPQDLIVEGVLFGASGPWRGFRTSAASPPERRTLGLGTLASHWQFSDALWDALPQAVFGLANDGALLFTNGSAERLLTRGHCLDVRAGRLTTVERLHQAELDRLLNAALLKQPVQGSGHLLMRRPDGGQPFAARIIPIMPDETDLLVRPTVLVVVDDPDSPHALNEWSLRKFYGLTPAEMRMAAALLQGHSLQSAGNALRSSVETLRCHLKSVFRKVGVSRQQDLVRLLTQVEMSSVMPPVDTASGEELDG